MAAVTPEQIDHFAISRNPRANLLRKMFFALRNRPSVGLVRDRLRNANRVGEVPGKMAETLGLARDVVRDRMHWVEHHPAHPASTFFVSPFDEAAICAIDGLGDFVSTSGAIGRGTRLEVLDRVYFPHSLGLAPYGAPGYVEALRRVIHLKPGGEFELDLRYFRHHSDGVSMTWEDGEPIIGPVYTPKVGGALATSPEAR